MASFGWTGGGDHCGCGRPTHVPLRLRLWQRGGAAMRRTWQVRRETSEQPDGQARWDQAYQLLLRWAATLPAADQEGASDAGSVLCARVHRAAAAGANH